MKDQAHTLRAIMAEAPTADRLPGELLVFVVNDLSDASLRQEFLEHVQEACRSFVSAKVAYVGHLPLQSPANLLKSNLELIERAADKTHGRVTKSREANTE